MNKKEFDFFRNKEYHYFGDGSCIVFINFDDLKEFTDIMTNNFFEEVCHVVLKHDYICIEAGLICEWLGIEVEELFPKEEEG